LSEKQGKHKTRQESDPSGPKPVRKKETGNGGESLEERGNQSCETREARNRGARVNGNRTARGGGLPHHRREIKGGGGHEQHREHAKQKELRD